MSLGEYIARGWEATVFKWEDGSTPPKALKLFNESRAEDAVREELELSNLLQDVGVNMPGVFGDVVEVDGRFGIVFERVPGPTMIDFIASHPWKIRFIARQLADIQLELHEKKPDGLPELKQFLLGQIEACDQLTDNDKAVALDLLDSLPGGDSLCHGDFHPGNILLRDGNLEDPVIIDWGNAATGDPMADLARSQLLITIGWRLLPRRRDRYLARFAVAALSRWHKARYLSASGLDTENLPKWRTVIAAARLNEEIPAERESLLEVVRTGLAQA